MSMRGYMTDTVTLYFCTYECSGITDLVEFLGTDLDYSLNKFHLLHDKDYDHSDLDESDIPDKTWWDIPESDDDRWVMKMIIVNRKDLEDAIKT
jgi:hypothetical protein